MGSGKKRIEKRKSEHIKIALSRDVAGREITTGLEKYRFLHQALPEINFSDISLSVSFLGKPLSAPFLISSMTGGTEEAFNINKNLALAAQERGWAMGLGSVRAAIENPATAYTFHIRTYAPDIPILANLGAVQLNYGYGADHCRRAVELTEADALVFHLNSMQEAFQPGGDTRFKGLLRRMEEICRVLEVPVGVKEVGWGIDGSLARRLFDIGVAFVDVAGAGGTSWIQVEKHRTEDSVMKAAAEAFADWGIPTSECIVEARREIPGGFLIASGGLKNGVDAAKAIALGADLAGFGRSLLPAAVSSAEEIARRLKQIELEMKIAMFGIGTVNVRELKGTDRICNIGERPF
ncbi:type 2 isopentenyl-diphosphate Delta-isomerase [Lihuaxuella thermophila]|uniref:Isopentenyl-diphosphate delta-isomerase n=1 Tax=Lihuaxuella thermophila TaxID=1173111 RepID=A0A1H8CNT1_9BACL|nr:type 2 isopentenyl-diphosphate Delta-isomerase [Lihuaxuella thermophila]SEM96911.1 isopentenyl-diphosphate delta-isomerase [Lihuaxuella thermophila]